LPQWSFDFWIIPYLLGKGLTLDMFRDFMAQAYKLLALEIADVRGTEKSALQQEYLFTLVRQAKTWPEFV
jgi:p-methyltransferase